MGISTSTATGHSVLVLKRRPTAICRVTTAGSDLEYCFIFFEPVAKKRKSRTAAGLSVTNTY